MEKIKRGDSLNSNKDMETQNVAFDQREKREKRKTKKKHGKNYFHDVKRMWQESGRRILRSVAVALAVIFVCAAASHFQWQLGYEVVVDGENIGFVADKALAYDAINAARTEVKLLLGENVPYDKEPVFVSRIVSGSSLATKEALVDNMLDNISTLTKGYVVYIDGEPVFGVSEKNMAEQILSQYKRDMVGDMADGAVLEFSEKVEVRSGHMHVSMLKTTDSALSVLKGDGRRVRTYSVQKNDTLASIAESFDMNIEEIIAINDNVGDEIYEGMVLNIESREPLLTVRCIRTVSMTEPVPYGVEQIEDDSLYEGRTVVEREGTEGSQTVVATVTTVNGVEVDKKVLSSETITEPIAKIEKIGTKERPATTGSGTFENPTNGVLSSRYGQRWNRSHNGIDICGSHNTDIKAADGGLVTYAGWMDGYGNYVIIDHENGYQTAYAHCASLDVAVGDRVTQGEVIAKMGSTGRSTGTHLHFEVKKDGVFVNPLEYVGY